MYKKDYTCANCCYYDCDEGYCQITGEHDLEAEDTCDGWAVSDDWEELTDEEKREIQGDMEAHRRMVEEEVIE